MSSSEGNGSPEYRRSPRRPPPTQQFFGYQNVPQPEFHPSYQNQFTPQPGFHPSYQNQFFPHPGFYPDYQYQQFPYNPHQPPTQEEGQTQFSPGMYTRLLSGESSANVSRITPDVNDENVVQPPSRQGTRKTATIRSQNPWTIQEDQRLVSAYMAVSGDVVVGTNQKMRSFWRRVERLFNESAEPGAVERNDESLKGRWRRTSPSVNQWVGCFEQAVRRKRSGYNDDDVIKDAQIIYERTHNTKFQYIHVWMMLRRYPKWESVALGVTTRDVAAESPESLSSGKRKNTDDDGSNVTPSTDEMVSQPCPRPEGVKKAKKKGKQLLHAQLADDMLELGNKIEYNAKVKEEKYMRYEERVERKRIEAEAKFERDLNTKKLDVLFSLMKKENKDDIDKESLAELKEWAKSKGFL